MSRLTLPGLLFLFGQLLFCSSALSQTPYIDGTTLILPAVKVGDVNYRVEFLIDPGRSPVRLQLTAADIEEDFNGFGAPELLGNSITIPKLRYGNSNYSLELTLVAEDPVLFDVTDIQQIAENFQATDLVTYSPEACQADIQLFGTETFQVQDQAEGYKGNFFGSKQVTVASSNFPQSALVSLRYGTILALTDTQAPGFDDGARLRSPGSTFTVAPDLGQENDPDYPLVFSTQVQVDGFTREDALYRANENAGLSLVLATGDEIALTATSGIVESYSDLHLAADGALFFVIAFEGNDNDYLVKQERDGEALVQLMATGEFLNTGSGDDVVRSIGSIDIESVNIFNQAVANVEVIDEGGEIEGFAYLMADSFTASKQCLASDASILCGNGIIADDESLQSFSSDGSTTGLLVNTAGGQVLDYKVIANPTNERLQQNVAYQGYSFHAFKKPLVCESRNALYFVGSLSESPIGVYDEIFRIDEFNNLSKISDFRSLLLDDSLDGQVPDEMVDWAIGYNCDLALYMRGPSGAESSNAYLGHWASYLTGETMEILDETPGRPNGNGAIDSVQSSTSGIDATARLSTRTGPEGEFYFVPRIPDAEGNYLSTYAIATKPECP